MLLSLRVAKAIPYADLLQVARSLARGQRQAAIAADLGWSVSRIQRCISSMRVQLAQKTDATWLDATRHGAVEVAQHWLAAQEDR